MNGITVWRIISLVTILDSRRYKQLNLLKAIGEFLGVNLVAILFLLGLVLINVASYLLFSIVIGLIVTGLTLILIALIIQFEKAEANKPPK